MTMDFGSTYTTNLSDREIFCNANGFVLNFYVWIVWLIAEISSGGGWANRGLVSFASFAMGTNDMQSVFLS